MSILNYIQNIFQIAVNKDNETKNDEPSNHVIYIQFDPLNSTTEDLPPDEHLESILFERLLMDKDDLKVNKIKIKRNSTDLESNNDELNETNPLIYLYLCFQRLNQYQFKNLELKQKFKNSILNQANKYLCNIYPTLDKKPIIVELLDKYYFEADDYLIREFIKILGNDDDCDLDCLIDILRDAYYNVLCSRFASMEFTDPSLFKTINYIKLLTSNSKLSLAFLKLNSPWFKKNDFNFDFTDFSSNTFILKTLIGHLLSISCLPKFNQPRFKYFTDAMANSTDVNLNLEKNIGQQIYRLVCEVHGIFLQMLKQGKDVKEETLNYISLVLYCFKNRSQLWLNQVPTFIQLTDGFILNFLHILLLLCKPFAQSYSDKLLKIDPNYCALPALQLNELNKEEFCKIHLRGLDQDSYLVNKPEEEEEEGENSNNKDESIKLKENNNYNFMTEIFFICHKAVQLGFKSCYDRFLTNASNLSELTNASMSGRLANDEMLKNEMNTQLAKFCSTKTIICQDDFVELLVKFNLATATWLTNLAMHSDYLDQLDSNLDFSIKKFYPFKLKVDLDLELNNKLSSKLLTRIPEFVCENVTESLIFVQRFVHNHPQIEIFNYEPLFTFILAFIASPQRMKNPHLRAKLAEVLDELKPKSSQSPMNQMMNRNQMNSDLFINNENKQYLIPCLIHVYVSIELTGQSVAFEQKFQYRRNIYEVIEYLWLEPTICEFYRKSMKELSNEAILKIENTKQPLFLRFINLMTNDATFVLDESLEHLSKLKQLQNEKDNNQWNNLNFNERREKEQSLMITERMCKWSCFNSKMMVTMLYYLTTEIKDIFCHEVYVDRLAQMLNYFLDHLVGPKRKDYKVKSTKEVYFNPAEIVFNICRIYVNLGHPNNNEKFYKRFCLGIVNDSRSYSDKLLQLAIEVLWKTKGKEVIIIEQIAEIDKFNKELTKQVQSKDIPEDEIPEEFLDPLLGTLMEEPVKLPSGYVVCKKTIFRHLLSDQTDPFTRQLLTPNMLIEEVELKARIDKFVNEYYEKKKENTASQDEEMKDDKNEIKE